MRVEAISLSSWREGGKVACIDQSYDEACALQRACGAEALGAPNDGIDEGQFEGWRLGPSPLGAPVFMCGLAM